MKILVTQSIYFKEARSRTKVAWEITQAVRKKTKLRKGKINLKSSGETTPISIDNNHETENITTRMADHASTDPARFDQNGTIHS